jgi:hypothetical protein
MIILFVASLKGHSVSSALGKIKVENKKLT